MVGHGFVKFVKNALAQAGSGEEVGEFLVYFLQNNPGRLNAVG
jgi:hypothetical protein